MPTSFEKRVFLLFGNPILTLRNRRQRERDMKDSRRAEVKRKYWEEA
jgi:hypothetical protein